MFAYYGKRDLSKTEQKIHTVGSRRGPFGTVSPPPSVGQFCPLYHQNVIKPWTQRIDHNSGKHVSLKTNGQFCDDTYSWDI
jgi:hypothetical protein